VHGIRAYGSESLGTNQALQLPWHPYGSCPVYYPAGVCILCASMFVCIFVCENVGLCVVMSKQYSRMNVRSFILCVSMSVCRVW